MYVYMYVSISISISISISLSLSIYIYIYIYLYLSLYICVSLSLSLSISISIYIYTHTYAYIYTYIYIYIYIYVTCRGAGRNCGRGPAPRSEDFSPPSRVRIRPRILILTASRLGLSNGTLERRYSHIMQSPPQNMKPYLGHDARIMPAYSLLRVLLCFLTDGVRTNGVFAEVPQCPLLYCHRYA